MSPKKTLNDKSRLSNKGKPLETPSVFPDTNKQRALKGVFFDLGGTLYSYRNVPHATKQLLLEACNRMGIKPDQNTIMAAYDRAFRKVARIYAEKAYYLHRTIFRDTFKHFVECIGAAPNRDVEDWYSEAYPREVLNCMELKEDCIATLSHLKACGIYLSAVSNIDEDMLVPLIKREGLDLYLSHWTSSEAAQSCKPDRRIFEIALDISGIEPDSVLFVGDSPEHDIVGANSLGMRTALIVDGGMEPPFQSGAATTQPCHTLNSLIELKKIFSE